MADIITDPQLTADTMRLANGLANGTPRERRAAARLAPALPLPVNPDGYAPRDTPARLEAMFRRACETGQYGLAHALNAALTELTLVAETPGLPLSPER